MDSTIDLNDDFSDFKELIGMVKEAKRAYDEYKKYKETIPKIKVNKVKKKRKRKPKRKWVRKLYMERDVSGLFVTTFQSLKDKDPEQFRDLTRMSYKIFDYLLHLLRTHLEKFSARAISPECRLFLTLIYLAHGKSRQELSQSFKLSVEAIRSIVIETSTIIWETLSPLYLPLPNSREWEGIANDFSNKWDLPNCVGAINAKYIPLTIPSHTNSKFDNFKDSYSIAVLGVCDADSHFTAADIVVLGCQSEGSFLTNTVFGKRLHSGNLNFPQVTTLPHSEASFPYYLVGNAAFPLKPYLMRPYPEKLLNAERKNFNKRLSRAFGTVENAFGILTGKWRILSSSLIMTPDSANKIVSATVVLHNFLMKSDATYYPPDYADREENGVFKKGLWRSETKPLQNVSKVSSNNSSRDTYHLRDLLTEYLYQNKL